MEERELHARRIHCDRCSELGWSGGVGAPKSGVIQNVNEVLLGPVVTVACFTTAGTQCHFSQHVGAAFRAR